MHNLPDSQSIISLGTFNLMIIGCFFVYSFFTLDKYVKGGVCKSENKIKQLNVVVSPLVIVCNHHWHLIHVTVDLEPYDL